MNVNISIKKTSIYVALSLILIIMLFPFIWLVLTSFKSNDEVLLPKLFFSPVLESYKEVFTDGLLATIGHSLLISILSVIITVPLGFLGGYAFARMKMKRKDNLFFFILTTRMAPPVVFGVPLYLLLTNARLLDTYIGITAVFIFMNLAFCIWLMRGYIEEIPYELEEAAYIDGGSLFTILRRVTMPLSIGGIITTSILVFIFSWNEFFYASILTGSNTGTYTVYLTSYFGSHRIEWGQLAAASTIVSSIPIVFAIFTRKYIVRGFTLGAVKGDK